MHKINNETSAGDWTGFWLSGPNCWSAPTSSASCICLWSMRCYAKLTVKANSLEPSFQAWSMRLSDRFVDEIYWIIHQSSCFIDPVARQRWSPMNSSSLLVTGFGAFHCLPVSHVGTGWWVPKFTRRLAWPLWLAPVATDDRRVKVSVVRPT